MTFTSKIAPKKLLVGGLATVALSLTMGATASVSAMHDNGHHNGSNPPVVASQCDHPGYRHFGFASRQDCLNYVASHTPGRGQGNGNGNGGYGGNGGNVNTNIFVSISNAVNTAVNVTINFVTNIFS